jgi:hypothetical protein
LKNSIAAFFMLFYLMQKYTFYYINIFKLAFNTMKKNLILTLLTCLISLCTHHAEAQTKQPKKPKDTPKKDAPQPNKGQSKDVQVFDQSDAKDDYDYFQKKKSEQPKNIIKINPLEVLNASFPVFYERVLSPKFSVEIGIGVTTITSNFAEFQTALLGDIGSAYEGFYKGKTGPLLKLGFRYYAGKGDDAPEGAYFALEYQMKKYNFDAYKLNANGDRTYSAPYQASSVTNSELLRILFGYQYEGNSNFTWDPYIGLGWRQTTFNGNYLGDNRQVLLGSVSAYKPVFIIGFKMGVAF